MEYQECDVLITYLSDLRNIAFLHLDIQRQANTLSQSIRTCIHDARATYIDTLLEGVVEYPDEEKQYFSNRLNQ